MKNYEAQVLGDSGSPVLLLPGGAARSQGFFPHLERALTGHRVVLVDRQGTGTAAALGPATLPDGSRACAEVLAELGAGPAVVVGQSLGGALAVQLAIDHPELVSGLVLVDPTPFNEPKVVRMIGPMAKLVMAPTKLPAVGGLFTRLLNRGTHVADDLARGVLKQMDEDKTLALTVNAVGTLPAQSAALTARLRRLDVPVVLLTADRKPKSAIRRAHERMAAELGGRVVSWPGATHSEHLREPEKVNELVLSVLEEVAAVR